MKHLITLVLVSGILIPQISSAQLVVNGPETATTQSIANSTFHNFVIAMNSDAADLYTPEGLSLSVASPIYFNYQGGVPGIVGDWTSSPLGGSYSTLEFVKVTNYAGFRLGAGTSMDIGFIGEESVHNTEFGISDGSSYTKLFAYNAGGDNPPMSYSITASADAVLQFEHCNYSHPAGTECQTCPERFRTYRVMENGELTSEYLFAIADRNCAGDADYDDGFFYVSGSLMPVPEPAHLGAFGLAGLAAYLLVRRRIHFRS